MFFIKRDEIGPKIEQILHPKILQKMKSSMESFKEGVMVVVIPLLVEKEYGSHLTELLLLIVMLIHRLSV